MKVFITGATGYIGGSVATRLLERGDHVIGLARSAEAAAALKKRGIEPLMGDLDDYIVPASLGAEAGPLGAILLGEQALKGSSFTPS